MILVAAAASTAHGLSAWEDTTLPLEEVIVPGVQGLTRARTIGDVDGDAMSELSVTFNNGSGQAKSVLVLSGLDRRTLQRFDTPKDSRSPAYFGLSTAMVRSGWSPPALLISDPYGNAVDSGGRIFAVDPVAGNLLGVILAPQGVYDLGWHLLGEVDLNGDGIDDFLALASGGMNGHVVAFDGSTWAELWRFQGVYDERLEGPMDLVDDVDGDGVPDILVGSRFYPLLGQRAGRVLILSGRSGGLLWSRAGSPGELMARDVAVIGDVTRDGVREFAYLAGGPSPTQVVVVDGATLRESARWDFSSDLVLVTRLGACGDRDSDGVGDLLLIGVGLTRTYNAWCFSSVSGRVAWRRIYPSAVLMVADIADTGDVTGDGQSEVVVAVTNRPHGHLDFFQFRSLAVVEAAGLGPGGRRNDALELRCPSLPGGRFALFYSWSRSTGTPLGSRSLPLDPSNLLHYSMTNPLLGRFDGAGQAVVPIRIPGLWGRYHGLGASGCFVGLDPAYPLGVRAISNAVDVTFQ